MLVNTFFVKKSYFSKHFWNANIKNACEMLVDAHEMRKCKIWVKCLQKHNLSCNLDENLLKYANLKIHELSCFFMNFACFRSEIFEFAKCKNARKSNSTYYNQFLFKMYAKLCVGNFLIHTLHFCSL